MFVVQVDDDPMTVQLLFEPSGRPFDDQNYYMNEKDNVCVVCGADESYIRKNIIPREYRKYVCLLHRSTSFALSEVPLAFIPLHAVTLLFTLM